MTSWSGAELLFVVMTWVTGAVASPSAGNIPEINHSGSGAHNSPVISDKDVPGAYIITDPPVNLAVEAGQVTKLTCRSNSSQDLGWSLLPFPPATDITLVNFCQLNPAYRDRYDVEAVGFGQCNLVVLNAANYHAGKYICSQTVGFDPFKIAQLVVIDVPPECEINGGNDVIENQIFDITCRSSYTANLSPMKFNWTDANGNPLTPVSFSDTSSRIEVLAKPPLIGPFFCHTFFADPKDLGPDDATNAPDYSKLWTSDQIKVLYCPVNVAITAPSGRPLKIGDIITCSAIGYPPPTYSWTILETGETTIGSDITVWAEGEFDIECKAANIISEKECSEIASFHLSVLHLRSPINYALNIGDNPTLGCQYGDLMSISWSFIPAGKTNSIVIVSDGCNVVPGALAFIDVDRTDGCNLVILLALAVHAGQYTCKETTRSYKPFAAEVTVFESAPICSTSADANGETADEHSFVLISCLADVIGNLKPVVDWTFWDGELITNATSDVTNTSVRSYILIQAFPPFVLTFDGHMFFNPPPPAKPESINEPADNAPDFDFFWRSPIVKVLYCPRNVVITSGDIYIGDTLTCSSDSVPPATYIWTNEMTGEQTHGPTILIASGGQHALTCTATNEIIHGVCSVKASINFTAILQVPLNTFVYVGNRATLYCNHNAADVSWLFSGVDQKLAINVAIGCEVTVASRNVYQTEIARGGCNLIIPVATFNQAGTYICQDKLSLALPQAAELTVLEADPVCKTNMSNKVIINDVITLSCSLGYASNLDPAMQWKDNNGLTISGIVHDNKGNFTSSITVKAAMPAVPSYTCTTIISIAAGDPASPVEPADNPIGYKYAWASPKASVTDPCKYLLLQNNNAAARSFNLTRAQMKVEQGDYFGNYWIGLDTMHLLSLNTSYKLSISIQLSTGLLHSIEYSQFLVSDENSQYTLTASGYSGNYPDALSYHTGMKFTTADWDNDQWVGGNCALGNGAGWWFDGSSAAPPPEFTSRGCFFACLTCYPDMVWYYATPTVAKASVYLVPKVPLNCP